MEIASGYSVLDNGQGKMLMFQYVNPVDRIEVREDGGAIKVSCQGGDLVLRDFPPDVRRAIAGPGVLLVGVDSLSRPRVAAEVSSAEPVLIGG